MQLNRLPGRRLAAATLLFACVVLAAGCQRGRGASHLGTFRMGERVQAGQFVYNVLEAEWKPTLDETGRMPAHRFLILRVSVTNSGGEQAPIPPFELEARDGTRYPEVTENVESVRDWLGLLRMTPPAATEQGAIVFDAPMAAYRLVVRDGGEIEDEKYALIDVPVHLE